MSEQNVTHLPGDGKPISELSGDESWLSTEAPTRDDVYAEVAAIAQFSPWAPFHEAYPNAPLTPGVYLFREAESQTIVYVGHAGERAARGDGIRGRLAIYRSGKGSTSGFGMAALDQALADEGWVAAQLDGLRSGQSKTALVWAQEAIARMQPEISWATTTDKAAAKALEERVEALLRPHGLLNRPRRAHP